MFSCSLLVFAKQLRAASRTPFMLQQIGFFKWPPQKLQLDVLILSIKIFFSILVSATIAFMYCFINIDK
jgi:hypothetical protein